MIVRNFIEAPGKVQSVHHGKGVGKNARVFEATDFDTALKFINYLEMEPASSIGEEVVYFEDKPVWAMNYYGYILRDDLISASQAGQMIKASLSCMYKEGRFLGGFEHTENGLTYVDTSEGNADHFHGREFIRRGQETAYELVYHGGSIRD